MKQKAKLKCYKKAGTVTTQDSNSIITDIYNQYPAYKNLGKVTLKPDTAFTRQNTGLGEIEYFSPNQDTIRYPNGYNYAHPQLGTHGIVYNPNMQNAKEAIRLDMLHGMPISDPIYAKHRAEFGDAFKQANQPEINHWYNQDKATQGTDGKQQYEQNYIDGIVRGLMLKGNPESMGYSAEANKFYLRNPNVSKKAKQIENYLQFGNAYMLPEAEVQSKKTGGLMFRLKKGGNIKGYDDGNLIKDTTDWITGNVNEYVVTPASLALGNITNGALGVTNPNELVQVNKYDNTKGKQPSIENLTQEQKLKLKNLSLAQMNQGKGLSTGSTLGDYLLGDTRRRIGSAIIPQGYDPRQTAGQFTESFSRSDATGNENFSSFGQKAKLGDKSNQRRIDASNLFYNKSQLYDTFKPSEYSAGTGPAVDFKNEHVSNLYKYKIAQSTPLFKLLAGTYIDPKTKKAVKLTKDNIEQIKKERLNKSLFQDNVAAVMNNATAGVNLDDKGNPYISYYDLWDLKPDAADISGKSYDIYGRRSLTPDEIEYFSKFPYKPDNVYDSEPADNMSSFQKTLSLIQSNPNIQEFLNQARQQDAPEYYELLGIGNEVNKELKKTMTPEQYQQFLKLGERVFLSNFNTKKVKGGLIPKLKKGGRIGYYEGNEIQNILNAKLKQANAQSDAVNVSRDVKTLSKTVDMPDPSPVTYIGPKNGPSHTQEEIDDFNRSIQLQKVGEALKSGAKVAANAAQLASFIPGGQPLGIAGNYASTAMDIYELGKSAYEGDNTGSAINLLQLGADVALNKYGYNRAVANVTPGSFAERVANIGSPAIAKSGYYAPLTAMPHLANNPVIKTGINANRAILGKAATEASASIMDAGQKGFEGTRFANPNRTLLKTDIIGTNIPYNKETGKFIQDEYIDEMTEYFNSDAFKKKMQEYHPDINIDDYTNSVMENLKRTQIRGAYPYEKLLTSDYEDIEKTIGGIYYTRDNMPNNVFRMPGAPPLTLKRKIQLGIEARNNPAYQSHEKAGQSITRNTGSTIEHELNHQRTNANWLLPDYLTQDYLQKNLAPSAIKKVSEQGDEQLGFNKYYSIPTEFDARLLNLKRDLKDHGIIDFTKSNDFTVDHLEELKKRQISPMSEEERKKSIAEAYDDWQNMDISKETYEKLVKHFNSPELVVNNPRKLSQDTHALFYYWPNEFLVENLKKLPGLAPYAVPTAAGVGAYQYSQQNRNKPHLKKGGMIKRADGSYSQRGLWDNIRANKGSGNKPTKAMLKQEKKIKAQEKADGGTVDNGFTNTTPAVGRWAKGNVVKNIDLKIPQYKQPNKPLFQNQMFAVPLPAMQNSFVAGEKPSVNINNDLNTGLEFTKVYIPGAKIPMQYGVNANYQVNPNLNINGAIRNNGFNLGIVKKFAGGGGIEYADSKFWEDRPVQKQLHAPGYKQGGKIKFKASLQYKKK